MNNSSHLSARQKEFIDFLVQSSALQFGEFITKSGRRSPYFINTGKFDSGPLIATLGRFYAHHIVDQGLAKNITTLFGPAYKGIPLCVTTAVALSTHHAINLHFSFDRKEQKAHGDKGMIVGHQLSPSDSVLIVEDVLTAGTTLKDIVPRLRHEYGVSIAGVVLAVDRMEKGSGTLSAVQEVQNELGISVFPLVNLKAIMRWLELDRTTDEAQKEKLLQSLHLYHQQYGVQL